MLRTSIRLTCLIALFPFACQQLSETTGETSGRLPSGAAKQEGANIAPPKVKVPYFNYPGPASPCAESAFATAEEVGTWEDNHARLITKAAEFQKACDLLRKTFPNIVPQSKFGTLYPPDPSLVWVNGKALSVVIVTISPAPASGNGSPAIIGTTTDTLATNFACGKQGPRNVLCASSSPPPAGDWVVVSTILTGPIPLDDTSLSHQYAFVFDEDGDPSNDYLAPAEYPYDFFDGTDRWYQVTITAGGEPNLMVQSAKNGTVQPYASNARFVLENNLVMALIPLSEFAVPCPEYRSTTFAHHGDYGLNPPHFWGGDTEPTIEDGLYGVCET